MELELKLEEAKLLVEEEKLKEEGQPGPLLLAEGVMKLEE